MGMNWAKKLKEVTLERGNPPVGEDWYTAVEMRQNLKIGHSKMYEIIRDGIASGTMEIHQGSKWSDDHRQLVRGVWYRFINPN